MQANSLEDPKFLVEALREEQEHQADRMGEEDSTELEALFRYSADLIVSFLNSGLIQFGDNPETRCYSVWGFDSKWHHDPDLFEAIKAAVEGE